MAIQPDAFRPIELEVLRINKLKPFDIFIHLGGEYLLYSRAAELFTEQVRRTLLDNRVPAIYVARKDEDLYQQYVEHNLPEIVADPSIPPEKKSSVVYDSGRYLMSQLFSAPRAAMINRTSKTVGAIVDMILRDHAATRQLIRITEFDYYTYTHSMNVGIFGIAFARELVPGLSRAELNELALGFFLHDIGKSRIPAEILNKKNQLDDREWALMKQHPEFGYEIITREGGYSRQAAQIVMQHHERIDGSGYPRGLRGDRINLFSRICAVADTFDAMTTQRCYQNAFSAFDALTYIRDNMLRMEFDRDFFTRFVRMFSSHW